MKRKIFIGISIMIILFAIAFSILKFGVWNPISSCCGMLEILFTNKQYTIVQHIPNKVIFSKTGDTSNKTGKELLDEYMQKRGFEFLPEGQMGAKLVYNNGSKLEKILFTTNAYYSEWRWTR